MGLIQNLLLKFAMFYLSLPLPKDSPANVPSAIDTAGDATDVVFEFLPFIRVYSDGRVERLCGTDSVPPSFDSATSVLSKDVLIDSSIGLATRLYLPTAAPADEKLPILIYFHGGAFLVDSPFSPKYHSHLNSLSSLGPLLAVSVNYSLAPEHPLPAAYDDSWAAIRWVLSRADPWLASRGDFRRVHIAGDSAGANICHQMAVRAREEAGLAAIKGMALVDPYFMGKEPIGTERRDAEFREDMDRIWRFICPSTAGLDDPRINPVSETAPSLAALGCERVLVAVAGNDILWSRGWVYYEKLRSSGWPGSAEIIDTPDAEHDFHIEHPETEKAAALTRSLAAFFASD
ncbi:putative carboxylesterase 2 [Apostasia shenzhenica]|uniref:Putative carboxylesterase 2 n=1 Tax=Apostasia shenzhenica TaxID=1088818 RepID=A0A2I0A316_9ASPA|nr:putative carboxylesterase 2 [Apostasia shenzhenica]